MDEGQEVAAGLLVPSCHSAILLDSIDEPLHQVSYFVQVFVKITWLLAVHLGRNDRLGSFGWDVFLARSSALHSALVGSATSLRVVGSYKIVLSEDAIEDYLQRCQCMLAARQQDPVLLKKQYHTTRQVMLRLMACNPRRDTKRSTS